MSAAAETLSPWLAELPQGAVPVALHVLTVAEVPAFVATLPELQARWLHSSALWPVPVNGWHCRLQMAASLPC